MRQEIAIVLQINHLFGDLLMPTEASKKPGALFVT
jgi:hypothetical protein